MTVCKRSRSNSRATLSTMGSTSKASMRKVTLFLIMMMATLASVVAATATAEQRNVIDNCWMTASDEDDDDDWKTNRTKLADCGVGFGAGAQGGKDGDIYTVTTAADDDDPRTPKLGSLRYGVTQKKATWVIFSPALQNIILKSPLSVSSHTTIDGRGAKVVLGNGGPCIRVSDANNVIIHGITLSNCHGGSGDAITVTNSSNVWIDHVTLSRAEDGLLDVTLQSTDVTISNCRFTHHNKVMLLGHADDYGADSTMRVTVVLNHFGPNLTQRLPHVRFGYAHVVNNFYDPWNFYAIGGRSHPSILCESNVFSAGSRKLVLPGVGLEEGDRSGGTTKLSNVNNLFFNGASWSLPDPAKLNSLLPSPPPIYSVAQRFTIAPAPNVAALTNNAGALSL